MAIDLRGRSSVSFYDTYAEFPLIGSNIVLYVDRDTLTMYLWDGTAYEPFDNGGGGSTITPVANYDALPDPTTVPNEFYWCSNPQGTYWLPGSLGGTYRPSGLYYSNAVSWEYTPTPYNASQAVVDAGTNDDQFITPSTFTNSSQLAGKFPNPTGTASQYVRGDGTLATLPSSGSGGSSVFYYLNGSVAASVATYKQMDFNAVIGLGTNFTLVGNGLIAQFLTDAGNPNRLLIPGGAWNFEMFFSMSSTGGSQKFYVELLKYDGATFTSIASSSTNPEAITGGTTTDLYITSLAVPETVLLATDRLAIRVYIVDSSGGRTATLHTEDNNLCQIITTFAGGISSLNGLTANTQNFAIGTTGTDFNISSVTDIHTFNLPTASATNRGALSTTDWSAFNEKASYTPRVQSVTSAATVTPTNLNDLVKITAQAAALALANPTGAWDEGQSLMIRIKDNGTARAITYDTNYRAIGVTLPTTTVISKTTYLGLIYNSTDTKWDVIGVTTQA